MRGATWTKLTNPAPDGAQPYRMILLTDGTVMAQSGTSANWLRLTPDADGSYINGVWDTSISPMSTRRFSFATEILPSGKVWVFGGENYGPNGDAVWTATGEMWDPIANTWSPVATFPPQNCFGVTYNVTGNTVSGSPIITNIPTSVTPTFLAGWTVAGPGIPNGSVVTTVDSNSQVHISNNATLSQTSAALQFSGTPDSCFGDESTSLISEGQILGAGLVSGTYLYSIATNSWTFAANKVYESGSDEEGWTKLADGRILTYDIGKTQAAGQSYAEIYDPVKNMWSGISPADGTANGTLPLLTGTQFGSEIGPSLRLLDGRSFLAGASGHTALYTPSTNTWAPGPDIVGNLHGNPAVFGADDAPAAILPNGHVLLSADAGPSPVNSSGNVTSGSNIITNIPSTANLYVSWPVTQTSGAPAIPAGANIVSVDSPSQIHMSQNATATGDVGIEFGGAYSLPTQIFDFNPVAGTISPVSPAINDTFLNTNAYQTSMLMLPTGQLLFADGSYQLWVYTPDGSASPQYQPVTNNVVYNGGGVFTLTGKQITGQSAGAAYGDDAEMDENYPIVRLTSPAGKVFYCRTTNWSSVGVATGTTPETVNFTLHPAVTPGTYALVVSAAGISSPPTFISITQAEVNGQ